MAASMYEQVQLTSSEDNTLPQPKQERMQSGATESTQSGERSPTVSTRASSPLSPFEDPEGSALLAKLESMAVAPEDVALGQRFSDAVQITQENSGCRQMVGRMVRMLRLCDYESDMIALVLAVSLVHLDRIFRVTDARMEDTERVSIAVLQCFNAHCYVMDEACPMRYWQSNIYSSYCNVKVLNSAAFKLLKILKYKLSVTEEEVAAKRDFLMNETA